MATSSWTRRRAGLAVAASAAAVLTATSMAAAHEGTGDENVLHGCVHDGSGALRVVSATRSECRPNETPVHWPLKMELPAVLADGRITYDEIEGDIELPPGSVDGSTVRDASLTTEDLADGTVIAADVRHDTLTGEHIAIGSLFGSDIADHSLTGDDIQGQSLTGSHIADSTLSGDDIADNSLSGQDIAMHSLTEFHIAWNSLTGDSIANGSLTGWHIADGAIAARDLAPGAVTPQATAPEVAVTTSVPLSLGDNWSAGAPLTSSVTVPARGMVMVSGQVQLALLTPCNGCSAVVKYRVLRSDGVTSPTYRVQLTDATEVTDWPSGGPVVVQGSEVGVASISWLDENVPAGEHQYTLQLHRTAVGSSGAAVMTDNMLVTAQVLGAR